VYKQKHKTDITSTLFQKQTPISVIVNW